MAITEVKDPNSVHLGLGTLGLLAYPQGSPPGSFLDVGYIKKMDVTYNRELKDFESAGILIVQLAFRDRLTAEADWAEVSPKNLNTVLPQPNQAQGQGYGGTTVSFGGSRTINFFALRFESVRQTDGKTITFDMFKCTPSGEFKFAFAEEDFITYPVSFGAQVDTTKPAGTRYGRITIAS